MASSEQLRTTNLYSLDPQGPFRPSRELGLYTVGELAHIGHDLDRLLQLQARWQFAYGILGINSMQEMLTLARNKEARKQPRAQAYKQLAELYSIPGSRKEVEMSIQRYGEQADSAIRRVRERVLGSQAPYFEMTNDVQSVHHPVDLVLLMVDPMVHPDIAQKVRFEAMRKLILMDLIASIDQRERMLNVVGKFDEFIDLLNQHVWTPGEYEGAFDAVYVVSDHNPETFSTESVQIVKEEESEHMAVRNGQKRTFLRRRSFMPNGLIVPGYASEKRKPQEDQAIKMVIKGVENPDLAIEDRLGLMIVPYNIRDVVSFFTHLPRSLRKAGFLVAIEDIENRLVPPGQARSNGNSMHEDRSQDYEINQEEHMNVASGKPTVPLRMLKFYVETKGMRIEILMYDIESGSFTDSLYADVISHKLYEIDRFFKRGGGKSSAADQLFPEYIFRRDLDQVHASLIEEQTEYLRDPRRVGPPL